MQIIPYLKNLIRKKPKIIVILGQTATGKSDLAVQIAKTFNGEVISADSRQVYEGLDLASGKISQEEMEGIPHHMLDIVDINTRYTVADYVCDAKKCIRDILDRGRTPIICGGTGFYIDALVQNQDFPDMQVDEKLTEELESLTTEKLLDRLEKQDPKRRAEIDPHNRVRIIRALEIIETLGYFPQTKKKSMYTPLYIGLRLESEELKERIYRRIVKRLEDGMVEEVQALDTTKERLHALGLEARAISKYLENEIDRDTMIEQLFYQTCQFAKRQRTWFKRNKKINWYHPKDTKKISRRIKGFL